MSYIADKMLGIADDDPAPDGAGYYYFPVELVGWGENADEAWREAQEGFSQDPGPTPEKYDFEEDAETCEGCGVPLTAPHEKNCPEFPERSEPR